MSQQLYILLGKYGDLCELLRLCGLKASRGEHVTVMVSKQYADLLDGISYVDRLVFDGKPHELEQAHTEALKHSDKVKVCQVVGPAEAVRKLVYVPNGSKGALTDSFVKEMWRVCGHLNDWKETARLHFDRRDKQREAKLFEPYISKKRQRILVMAESQSSPFPYANLLWTLLRLKFPKAQLVDLSEVKAERPYDLLTFFEQADALVSVDTFHLHLAAAVPTLPVVAITNDKPSLWFGSPWQPQYVRYIRYGDFPGRCTEILDAIEGCRKEPAEIQQPDFRIVHVWSQYEVGPTNHKRHEAAAKTWAKAYESGNWTPMPIEWGMCGNDTGNVLKDDKRLPFVKDVFRLACQKSRPDDLILWTRADACMSWMILEDLNKDSLVYSHRSLRDSEGLMYHPAIDLFAFPKKWWQAKQHDFPNFVMGYDHHWQRVLLEMLKKDGAKELPFMVWREMEKEAA